MKVSKKELERWDAERDLGYIQEYQKIMKDPKRMKAAQQIARQKADEYGSMFDDGSKRRTRRK